MATKHTPGPWQVFNAPDGRIFVETETPQQQPHFSTIAQVDPGYGRYGPPEANAHLIAAAPDLYEALGYLLAERCEDRLCGSLDCNRARAALAKARGEQVAS